MILDEILNDSAWFRMEETKKRGFETKKHKK